MSAKDFKTGEAVIFDNRSCMVRTKGGKKCLAIPMPLGWFHFEPVDWNDVQRVEKTEL
jgi:hypothetical protein